MLTPWNMWDPSTDLHAQMDRLLDDFFGGPSGRRFASMRRFPPANAWEDDANLYVEAELPGLKLEDLDISVLGNELTIHGRPRQAKETGATYHLRERGTDEFTRMLTLPAEVNADKVSAILKNGVLTITMPKAEAARPRKIAIKTD
jgi:HSP20 family protein